MDNPRPPAIMTKGKPMLRGILTATALLCPSQAAFVQELTAEQREESDKLAPACKKVLEAAEKK
jgi:hypothetical protein